jgi:hypothetical protein
MVLALRLTLINVSHIVALTLQYAVGYLFLLNELALLIMRRLK